MNESPKPDGELASWIVRKWFDRDPRVASVPKNLVVEMLHEIDALHARIDALRFEIQLARRGIR